MEFRDITLGNWNEFRESVLESELTFSELIRSTENEFLEILDSYKNVCRAMFVNNQYIGNSFGKREGSINSSVICLANLVINENFRKKGYGIKLLDDFVKESHEKEYTLIEGYFRPNHSLPLVRRLGAKEKSVHKNWFGTGEDYVFCELEIS